MLDVAPSITVSLPPFTRSHCQANAESAGSPSTSAIALASAVSSWPSRAVPVIVGAPVAASFTAVTSTVIVLAAALSDTPSLTLNVKLA